MTPAAGRKPSYREGLWFGALSFGSIALLSVFSSVAIARIYGVEIIGQFALAYAPVGAVWYLSSVREQAALVRELAALEPRAPRVTGLFVGVFAFSQTLTLVVGGLAVLASWFVFHGPIDHPSLFLPALANMVTYVVLINPSWNLDTIFCAFRAGRQLFWIRLIQAVVYLVVAIGCGLAWHSIWSIVIATAASALTALIHRCALIRRLMRWRVPRVEIRAGLRTLPQIVRFGLKITPGMLAEGVSNESGTWIIGVIASIATVGAYSRAWQLARRFVDLDVRICEMLFPTLVERHAAGDDHGFDRALIDTIRYVLIGLLLLAAVGAGASNGIMDVFGGGFRRAAPALAVLMVLPALQTVSSILRHALFALDRPVATTVSGGLRMAATLAVGIPLSLWLGSVGTGAAVIVGLGVDVLSMAPRVHRELASPLRVLWPLRQVAALLAAYAAGIVASRVVDLAIPTFAGLVLATLAGSAAYVAVLLTGGALNARDRQRLAAERGRLRLRRPAMLQGEAG
ncbi:MAG TPA: oligosaccharide flippase family protein [Conexibacter sp.]|jgi:O-antigen/teichoic acid export membrane protein|nr:oligosaccharide flippase family protein [Conexibacter sp.]